MKSVMEYSKFVVALSLENQDKLDRIFLLLFSTVYILLIYRNHYILVLRHATRQPWKDQDNNFLFSFLWYSFYNK